MNVKLYAVSKRLASGVAALALVAGCSGPLDLDLRGKLGGFSTSDAALSATSKRPKPDQRGIISYPGYQVAVAKRGDRVADVASRIDLPAAELAKFNGLQADDTLRDGEVLALPRRVAEPAELREASNSGVDIARLAGSAIDAAPETPPVQTTELAPTQPEPRLEPKKPDPQEPVRHKVTRGETAYTISRLYQVPVKALGEWNGLGEDFAIREGQYLLIPVPGAEKPKSAVAAAAAETKVSEPGEGSVTPTPPSATKPLPQERVAALDPEPPKVTVQEPTRAEPETAMQMPVNGSIIREYSKGKNDGIDIAAKPGTPVVAAAEGKVAAITSDADQVPIIVLRHPDNVLTVYANVDGITVKKGDSVKRGAKIAAVRPGDNSYLHFEVRNGFDSVDPNPYLQ